MLPASCRRQRTLTLLLGAVVAALILCTASLAFAQGPSPAPAAPPLSQGYVVMAIVGLIVGFATQGLKQGNLLGIIRIQAAWAPYLGLLVTFGTGLDQGLAGQATLTSAVWFNAVLLGLTGLMAQGGGAALHGHTHDGGGGGGGDGAGSGSKPSLGVVQGGGGGRGSPPAAARTSGTFAMALLGLALLLSACPQAAAVVPPVFDCGSAIVQDALAGKTLAQIEADVGPRCGQDLIAIITGLLGSKDPSVEATPAYAEAVRLKAALSAPAAK